MNHTIKLAHGDTVVTLPIKFIMTISRVNNYVHVVSTIGTDESVMYANADAAEQVRHDAAAKLEQYLAATMSKADPFRKTDPVIAP